MSGRPLPDPMGSGPLRWRGSDVVRTNHGDWTGWLRAATSEATFVLGWLQPFVQPPPRDTRRLVFVCVGNLYRSAFAGAAARHRTVRVASFGFGAPAGSHSPASALAAASRFGIDLSPHTASRLGDYEHERGDLVLAMETRHVHQLVERGIPAPSIRLLGHWARPHRIHLHDPNLLSDRYLQTCFTLIHSAVSHLVDDLVAMHCPCMLIESAAAIDSG